MCWAWALALLALHAGGAPCIHETSPISLQVTAAPVAPALGCDLQVLQLRRDTNSSETEAEKSEAEAAAEMVTIATGIFMAFAMTGELHVVQTVFDMLGAGGASAADIASLIVTVQGKHTQHCELAR